MRPSRWVGVRALASWCALLRRDAAFLSAVLLAVVAGCGEETLQPDPDPSIGPSEKATWTVIRDDILAPNCAGCHVAGSSFARQSNLVLTADVAYEQLVDVRPTNSAALEDGLWRLGTNGVQSLFESFLWEKINAPDQAHLFSDHPHYGALMPLGAPPLTNGELEYIRSWILAGAPKEGRVADVQLLDDTTRYVAPAFAPLAEPANGTQLRLGPFDVAPQYERELYSYHPLQNAEDKLIERIEISMRPGSHHFIAYLFEDGTPPSVIPPPHVLRDIRDANGDYIPQNLFATRFHQFMSGTQWPLMSYAFPPGVALRLPAGKGLDLNSHYVNRTDEPMQGEVITNLHYADPTSVQHVADILFLSNEDFALPPRQVTTVTRTYAFDRALSVFQLFSHAHEHMLEFKVEIAFGPRDGERVYFARDWEHPPILELDPPLELDGGQGLRLIVTFDNWTDRTLEFGLLSEDEMMILFGYYYTLSGKAAQVTSIP